MEASADVDLADPGFGRPGAIDILLGVDVFLQVLLQGRRFGPPGSPVALETKLGWVLAGGSTSRCRDDKIATHHASLDTGDDILQRFWELEEDPLREPYWTSEERVVVQHFQTNHSPSSDARFIVPLPRKPDAKPLGESRSHAVKRFFSLERSLHSRGQFEELNTVVQEYFDMGHAEPVTERDCHKPTNEVFYLPIHAVHKESSSTTRSEQSSTHQQNPPAVSLSMIPSWSARLYILR